MDYLETERLLLRNWQPEDLQPFSLINQDPIVMKHFPNTLDLKQTQALVERIEKHFSEHGYGLYACILKETQQCIGFVGLNQPSFDAPFMPAVEIGWRLAFDCHGKGYATEAARQILNFAFTELGLDEVISFTVPANKPSIRVMEKIGMIRDLNGDFFHPALPAGHPLKLHVLYRLTK